MFYLSNKKSKKKGKKKFPFKVNEDFKTNHFFFKMRRMMQNQSTAFKTAIKVLKRQILRA